MNKKLIILGIVVLLFCVGLSGCTNNNIEGSGYVELSNLTIITKWRTSTWGSDSSSSWDEMNGFYHDYDKDVLESNVYYSIGGIVKNIGDKPIDIVTIKAKFYDNKSNHLCSSTCYVYDLYLEESKEFSIRRFKESCDFFDHIADYIISITVDLHE